MEAAQDWSWLPQAFWPRFRGVTALPKRFTRPTQQYSHSECTAWCKTSNAFLRFLILFF